MAAGVSEMSVLSFMSELLLLLELLVFSLDVVLEVASVCVDVCVACPCWLSVVTASLGVLLSSEGFGNSPEPDHNSEPEPEKSSLSLSLSSRLSFVRLVALGSLKISPRRASGALRRSTADAGDRRSES